MENKYCRSMISWIPYATLDEARAACSSDRSCSAVYDSQCNGANFNLCRLCDFDVCGDLFDDGGYSCVYRKSGSYC